MGRHGGNWNEQLHPRARDGKFGHGGGSSGGDTKRGMPNAIAGADIPVRGGEELALDFHPDGSATIATGKASVHLPDSTLSDLLYNMKHVGSEDAEVGAEAWVKRVDRDADGRPTGSSLAALVRKEGEGNYSLRLAESDTPSVEEMRNSPEVRFNDKDLAKINDSVVRGEAASRVDTGNGDADLLITDDNKFTIRHLGDDGRPIDVNLNPKSYAKISYAVGVMMDGWDEEDPSLADDEAVTKRTVPTNAGPVTVEISGQWGGTNPEDQLSITADDGSWGLIIDGPYQDAFSQALSKVADAGESLEIYDPSMRWAK